MIEFDWPKVRRLPVQCGGSRMRFWEDPRRNRDASEAARIDLNGMIACGFVVLDEVIF